MLLRPSLLAHICSVAAALVYAKPSRSQSLPLEQSCSSGARRRQPSGSGSSSGRAGPAGSCSGPRRRCRPTRALGRRGAWQSSRRNSASSTFCAPVFVERRRAVVRPRENALLTAGVVLRVKNIQLTLAPQLTTSANRPFQVIPYRQDSTPRRSIWANPFHGPASSIDLPFRFGEQPLRRIDAGQSSRDFLTGRLRMDSPRRTSGGARESETPSYSATTPRDSRTRSCRRGRASTLGPERSRRSGSSAGSASRTTSTPTRRKCALAQRRSRCVDAAVGQRAEPRDVPHGIRTGSEAGLSDWRHVDVLRNVGHPNTPGPNDTTASGPDQVFSFFGRWVFPACWLRDPRRVGPVRATALVARPARVSRAFAGLYARVSVGAPVVVGPAAFACRRRARTSNLICRFA